MKNSTIQQGFRRFGVLMAGLVMCGVIVLWSRGEAHRDGCHRWHSCPSDTGSYVCGDLGYTSECPVSETSITPTQSKPIKLQAPKRPNKVTRGIAYIHAYDLRAMGMEIVKEKSNWFQLGIKKLDMRIKLGSKTALIGSRRQSVTLKARPVLWEDTLYIPASALRTMGCTVDTRYLPSGVTLECAGVRSLNLVYVKTW